jgi:apolipoprotein N-acyltransferase
VSATVTPEGAVTGGTELFTRDVIVRTMHLGTGSTVATGTGPATELLVCGIAVAGLAAAVAVRPRRRSTGIRGRTAAKGDHA